MDGKSKADFVNSAASDQSRICLKCQTLNRAGARFCITCGENLEENKNKKMEQMTKSSLPFASIGKEPKVNENTDTQPVHDSLRGYHEPEGIFANGLPIWTVEPPQVMVRRKK